ncbi:MAG: Trm112 family protein [Pseudomonadota bacterium]
MNDREEGREQAPDVATDAPTTPDRKFSPRRLEALVCPVTGVALSYDADRAELVSRAANLAFPVRSGIPIMLVDEARRLSDE